ncbi:uncharacterized protein LOC134235127 [Saccostrea cucullata]|uniref:uncharacterized protein LOC134235127 n=1 Tax=Saccostrea cuccullata TaxID=36930 RepID=UPI002ED28380
MDVNDDKNTGKSESKEDDEFEDIQLEVDTHLAKYSTDHKGPSSKENGEPHNNVISDQPVDALPPPSYVSDVTVHNMDAPVVRQGPLKPKPKDYVVTSCFVLLCCNFIFGLLGYHFGVQANHAWQLGDEMSSRRRAKMALIFVICGVIAGLVTYILAFTLYFTLNNNEPVNYHHSNTQAG